MKNKVLIIFTVASIVLTGCSIEKRHYSRGYHIEWKHKLKVAENKDFLNEEFTSEPKFIEPTIIEAGSQTNFDKLTQSGLIAQNSSIKEKNTKKDKILTFEDDAIIHEIPNAVAETDQTFFPKPISTNPKKLDPLAIFSNIFALTGLLLSLITTLPAFIGFALPFLGFIFGLTSMVHISMNDDKYRGLALAIIGTFCTLIVLTIVLLLFLL
jgi:hypothetical protein